jgi:hypothetical protein
MFLLQHSKLFLNFKSVFYFLILFTDCGTVNHSLLYASQLMARTNVPPKKMEEGIKIDVKEISSAYQRNF